MFNCEWRKHCLPDVCVRMCVCVIYASHTLDYWWRPSTGSHSRGMWVCFSHPGPCNPRLESYWEQVYKGPPHPHQHNIPLPDRTNYTTSTTPCPKTSSHYLTTRLQRLYTLSAQWYFCCERRIRGSEGLITHLVLFVFIFLPYFIIQSRAPALATSYPKKKPLTESDRFICCTLMDGCLLFILRVWFQKRKLPMPKTERALSVGVHCCGSGQGFYSLLGKKEVHPQM